MRIVRVALFAALVACSSSSAGGGDDDLVPPASGGPFALTSPDLAAGGTIAIDATCDGANRSPALAWTGAPGGANSYVVALVDTTIGLAHWAIYDIPASDTSLAAGLEKTNAPSVPAGAKQSASYDPSVVGYDGPCPPKGSTHAYTFVVDALGVPALDGVTSSTSAADVLRAANARALGSATLAGSYARE